MREYEHALSLTNETSPGADRITYSMLKHAHPTLAQTKVKTFNRIYSENTFPMSWRTAIIIPILKSDKDPTDPTSYRPISLTSCLCKIMKKIINNKLIWYLENNKCINKEQSGFRYNRSTTDHLTKIEIDAQKAIANKEHTLAVFFDLNKAYDTAWRRGVLIKLKEYGLCGNLSLTSCKTGKYKSEFSKHHSQPR